MAYSRLLDMFHVKSQTTREKGDIGENIACSYLEKHGFLIIDRNYNKKWGELDIVAAKDKILHFIEVKSVIWSGIGDKKEYRPEENVHNLKQRRLKRVIQTYLLDRKYGLDAEFQFHVATVVLNQKTRRAKVILMENIIL